jgi:Protein of unknown function (DUF3224)
MTTTIETKLEIKSWDEKPYREFDDGRKFTRADVSLGAADGIDCATFDALMFYRADGTSSYVSLMSVSGTFDGRSGSFVLRGTGGYDGTAAVGQSEVVEGSGTGELTGLTGTLTSRSTHEDYPYMPLTLSYDFE